MKIEIRQGVNSTLVDLDELGASYSGVITVGRRCKEVWNAIAIDDETVDPFQCYIIGAVGGPWKLRHGQNRTECPKGLLSNKTLPCSSCMGRCVGPHPGKARYYQRNPEVPTLLNGSPLSEWGSEINPGDIIRLGNVELVVE